MTLCLEIEYAGYSRIVEPQIFGVNRKGNEILSAWFVRGYSESRERSSWRDYLLSEITKLKILEEPFRGPRPGYVPGGGKKFKEVYCELMA